jgi:hypothetical protein
MRLWLLKKLLRWYKRGLERRIDLEPWNKELSGKLDSVLILLEK